jgi:hypothetical protein
MKLTRVKAIQLTSGEWGCKSCHSWIEASYIYGMIATNCDCDAGDLNPSSIVTVVELPSDAW